MKFNIISLILILMCINSIFSQILIPFHIKIPTSNGDSLNANLYSPDTLQELPTIFIQTPYGKSMFNYALPLEVGTNINNSPYNFVVMDWRGKYSNANKFVPNYDLGLDGKDAIDWIANQSWSDNNIGTWGPSALGVIQYMTAKHNPTYLKAIMPLVCSPTMFYNDFFTNGIAHLEYFNSLENLGYNHQEIFKNHPTYDFFWQTLENNTFYPNNINIPVLQVAGLFDYNIESQLIWYDTLKKIYPDQNYIIIGPWTHSKVDLSNIGDMLFNDAQNFSNSKGRKFFDFYLRNINNNWNNESKEHSYVINQTWTNNIYDSNLDYNELIFTHDKKLKSIDPYQNIELSYSYNPLLPSPTIGGSLLNSNLLSGPMDLTNNVMLDNDLLIFSTDSLAGDLYIQGKSNIRLNVKSNAKDTDITARLCYNIDGKTYHIADAAARLKFRNGISNIDTVGYTPNSIAYLNLEFPYINIKFPKNSKLVIIINSSNYPKYSRNMNTGEEMYPNNNIDTLINPQIAENSIIIGPFSQNTYTFHSNKYNTKLEAVDIEEIDFYPNPTNDFILLNTDIIVNTYYQIFDIKGNVIANKSIGNNKIDVSQLANGEYILKLFLGKNTKTGKFIKN